MTCHALPGQKYVSAVAGGAHRGTPNITPSCCPSTAMSWETQCPLVPQMRAPLELGPQPLGPPGSPRNLPQENAATSEKPPALVPGVTPPRAPATRSPATEPIPSAQVSGPSPGWARKGPVRWSRCWWSRSESSALTAASAQTLRGPWWTQPTAHAAQAPALPSMPGIEQHDPFIFPLLVLSVDQCQLSSEPLALTQRVSHVTSDTPHRTVFSQDPP